MYMEDAEDLCTQDRNSGNFKCCFDNWYSASLREREGKFFRETFRLSVAYTWLSTATERTLRCEPAQIHHSPAGATRIQVLTSTNFSYSSEKGIKGYMTTIKKNMAHSGCLQHGAVLTDEPCGTDTLSGYQLLCILCPKSAQFPPVNPSLAL